MTKLRKILGHLRDALGDTGATGIGRVDRAGFERFDTSGLTVRCHVEWPGEGPLRAAWETLVERTPEAIVFETPTWQLAGWNATHPAARLRLLTVQRGDELLAVVPLCLTDKRSLVSPSPAVSDYLEPLLAPEAPEDCVRAVLAFLAAQWDRSVVEVTFHNARAGAAFRRVLASVADGAGFTSEEKEIEQAPAISLPGTWAEYLDQLDAHERKEMRRKLAKAEEKGRAELLVCAAAEAQLELARVLDWMEQVGGEKGQAVKDFVRPLMEAAGVALVRERWLEVLTLRLLGEPVCGLLQFRGKEGPMLYNLGYDARAKEWSPGIVATAMAIRRAISQRHGLYDLLRGREDWKYRLGAKDRPLYKITLKKR